MIKTILKNGTIYSVDGIGWENRPAEAMAISDTGEISAIGTLETIELLKEEDTEIIDLENNIVLPGFIDSHAHVPGKAFAELFQINLFGIIDKENTIAEIKRFIEEHPELPEYFGSGFNMGMVDENGEAPNSSWLDEICSEKPIVIRSYDCHSTWANSKALEVSGITKDTPDPELGRIHRDENEEPTGLMTDCPNIGMIAPRYTWEQCIKAATQFVKTMNAWGYTAINSVAPHTFMTADVYKDIEANGDLSARIATAQFIKHKEKEQNLQDLIELKKNIESDLVKVTTGKYLIDGVIEGYTAFLKEPYDEATGLGSNYNSYPEWTTDELKESFAQVIKSGFNVHCHCIGDAATTMTLDAIEYAQKANGERDGDFRNIITHLQLVDPEDITRMARLGVIAAIQPFWHFKEPGFFNSVELVALGEERANREYPAKSFVDAGIVITASGDFPVSSENNPFFGIKAGVIRNLYNEDGFGETIDGPDDEKFLLGKEERLTVPQMIEAYTINGAYQMFRENEIGSLEVGKKADYIVIDKDPLKIDVMDIDKIKIIMTVFGGEKVYESNK